MFVRLLDLSPEAAARVYDTMVHAYSVLDADAPDRGPVTIRVVDRGQDLDAEVIRLAYQRHGIVRPRWSEPLASERADRL